MREWDISICGLNCVKCDIQESNECMGCRGTLTKHWSPDCEFIHCSKLKDVNYCFECQEFPCTKTEKFENDGYPHHKQTILNMRKMKEVGLNQFLRSQRDCTFCPK